MVQEAAGGLQGRWAEAMLTLATGWEAADGDALMVTAASLEESGFVNLAREAYTRASAVLDQTGERRRSRQAVAQREKCDHELGERFREGRFIAAAPTVHLTRREQDIVELAVQGLTDREIAQRSWSPSALSKAICTAPTSSWACGAATNWKPPFPASCRRRAVPLTCGPCTLSFAGVWGDSARLPADTGATRGPRCRDRRASAARRVSTLSVPVVAPAGIRVHPTRVHAGPMGFSL